MKAEHDDPLLRALAELPRPAPEASAEVRTRGSARAAFRANAAAAASRPGRAFASAGRAVLPLALAGIVCVYLTWAIGAATAIYH